MRIPPPSPIDETGTAMLDPSARGSKMTMHRIDIQELADETKFNRFRALVMFGIGIPAEDPPSWI